MKHVHIGLFGLLLLLACAAPAHAAVPTERVVLGHSAQGRELVAIARGPADAPRSVLVVGCIHGNECAGTRIVRLLRSLPPPPDTRLWLVTSINPDGRLARTRQNARGVDLNRNFPYRWRGGGSPFDTYYPGPRKASEPETRAALRFIRRVRPNLTIWYHQHLNMVVQTTRHRRVLRRYAQVSHLPLRALPYRYYGTATSWQAHAFPGSPAFVVELPAGPLSAASTARHRRAVLAAASLM